MALKEMKGDTHHKVMIASGGVSTDRDPESDLGGRLVWLMMLGLVSVAAIVMVTAPIWMNLSH